MSEKLTVKRKILSFLEKIGIQKEEYYKKIGVAPSNFKGVGLQSMPGGEIIVKTLTLYPQLSADWLLRDKGDMLIQNFETNKENERKISEKNKNSSEKIPVSNSKAIPLIPFSAMAGALTGEKSVLEYECERYVVPAFSGADFLMPVKGNSMMPTYISGDIVACQRVPMSGLFFQWNKPYVLDTAQGAIIKRIKPGSDKQHVLIVSDNKEYDPFELPYEDIYAVALVIGIIRLE
ncbi:S24 family peptidase [Pseudoprevotella muciniphila]|uniref:S24 family peptidase n=2 Tax=Pseudoprevotella muciniphila TaxID=2133944 RepID=A0A5P8E9X8_9BACT|nr:S24 family peptidase [Pseudoprevotella muciniphila]